MCIRDSASEEGLIGILVQNNDVFVHHTTRSVDDDTVSNWFTKYTWNGEKLIEPVELLSFHKGTGTHNGGVMIEDENGIVLGAIGDLGYGKVLDMQQQKNFLSAENNYVGSILSLNEPSEVYAVGIRNTYGLDIDPVTGILWDTENGPNLFDEVNLVMPNFNGGWSAYTGPTEDPISTMYEPDFIGFLKSQIRLLLSPFYGLFVLGDIYEYSDPEFSWKRTISPTALNFAPSSFGKYENWLFVGDCNFGNIYKFKLNSDRNGFVLGHSNLKDLVVHEVDSLDSQFLYQLYLLKNQQQK